MASFLLNLLPKDFPCDSRVELRHHKITYGFNATNDVVFNHTTVGTAETRKFTKSATFTNTMTLLGKTTVRVYQPRSIDDGINANFVNTGGEVDVDALHDSINASGFGSLGINTNFVDTWGEVDEDALYDLINRSGFRRDAHRRLMGILDEPLNRRNLVLPIYNMLRLYFIKRWASVRYEPEEMFYDDGHIRISNKQMYGCVECITCLKCTCY